MFVRRHGVVVRGHLGNRERVNLLAAEFSLHAGREPGSGPDVNRYATAHVGQREGRLSVSAIGGPEQ
jgi:hypothetical protein